MDKEVIILMHAIDVGESIVYIQYKEEADPFEQVMKSGKAYPSYLFSVEPVICDQEGNHLFSDSHPTREGLAAMQCVYKYIKEEGIVEFIEDVLMVRVLDILEQYGSRDEIMSNNRWEEFTVEIEDAWESVYPKTIIEK